MLDAQLYKDLAGICKTQVRRIDTKESLFNPTEYIANLAKMMHSTVDSETGAISLTKNKLVKFGFKYGEPCFR